MATRPLRLDPPVVAGDAFPQPILVISQAQLTHPEKSKSIALPLRCLTPMFSCRGLSHFKLVNLNLRYLMLGHNLMQVAPVCCNM